jgi:hypothetical protein
MGDFVNTALGKLVVGVAGVAAALAWFAWSGGGDGFERESRLPGQVLGGGGGTIKLEYSVNQPANLRASFEQ